MVSVPLAYDRQGSGVPLFPKVLWNRPVSRIGAGRILLPGGYRQDFSLVTAIFQTVMASGAGECVAALPDVLIPLLGGAPSTTFVPSSPSGSLGREALGRLIHLAEDADSVAIGANLSGNSDTSLLVERFLAESPRPIIAFGDVLLSLQHRLQALTGRTDGLLILTMPEAFKLAGVLGVPISIRRDGGLLNKLEIIDDLAKRAQLDLAVYGSEVIVSAGGMLGVTPIPFKLAEFPALYVGALATFWTQNASARYEGLMTGAFVLQQIAGPLTEKPETRVTINDATKALQKYLADAL